MDRKGKTILVLGATGKQGSAAVRHLSEAGWPVRIFCRDPGKPQARELTETYKLDVAVGNLKDRASLEEAVKGCYGVFSVLTAMEEGPEGEAQQGYLVDNVVKAAGVRHLVYSSVASAQDHTGIPFFDSKWRVEEHIRSLGIPHTILRPVWFMDNFNLPNYRTDILNGVLKLPLSVGKPLQMIAVDDIGRICVESFERPHDFMGKAIDIAGDELSMTRTAELLGEITGRSVRYVRQPIDEVRAASPDYATMFQWFDDRGYRADIPELRDQFPWLMTFRDWLLFDGWGSIRQEAPAAMSV